MHSRFPLFGAIFLMAACAPGGVMLSMQDIDTAYNPSELAYAGADRDMRVIVVGNPFSGDQAAFASAVTDAMQGQHWGQATNFTTTPSGSARDLYRVVMLFDPPKSLGSGRLCREEATGLPSEGSGDGIVLFGAFCRADKRLTSIRGHMPEASGAQDPAFRSLVAQVTNGLFPPESGQKRSRDRCGPFLRC